MVHAAGFRPWFDHARLPIPPLAHERSAGARIRATVSDQLAPVGKTRFRAPFRCLSSANSPLCSRLPALRARRRACARYDARPGRHSAFTAIPRGWPLSRTPNAEAYVVPLHQAPVPLRRIAMRCSRYGTAVIIAWLGGAGKIGVSGLFLINNAWKILGRGKSGAAAGDS